ncbi:MAG: MXAN_5187 C-terminal domain-containing protein [Polyangiales bacterium]
MNKAEFEAMIKDLEGELGLLKSRYEQWIQGIERVPPMRQKERLERRLRQLRREQPNNTAMRYRFQAVFSRWTTMNTYWQRITRQIEEGTFRRDVKKAKQRRKKIEAQEARASQPEAAAAQPRHEAPLELDLDADFDSEIGAALAALEAPKPIAPSAPTRSAPMPPTPRAPTPGAPAPAEAPPLVSKRFGRPVARSRISQPPAITGTPAPPEPPAAPQPGRHRPVPPPPPSHGRAAPPPPPPPPSPGRRAAPPPPPRSSPTRSSPTTPTLSPRAVTPRATPRTPAALRSAPKPAAGRSSLSDGDLQRVYDKYVSAKKQNNERVDNLSREKLAKKIRAMEPKLRQKYGSANVDFEVVVKGGRVGLKPKKKT